MSPARPEPSRNRIAATWAVVLAALLAGLAVLPGVELDRRRAEADSAEAHVAALDAAVDAAVAAAPAADPPAAVALLRVDRVARVLARSVQDRVLVDALSPLAAAWPQPSCLSVFLEGREVLGRNADTPLIPASVSKLFTAAGVLDHLDPDERLATRVVSASRPVDGVLAGDVWVVGGGDPLVATAPYADSFRRQPQLHTSMEALADALVALPLTSVRGRLLGDDSRHEPAHYVESWPDRYRIQLNTGPLSALTVNDGRTAFTTAPEVTTAPALWFVTLLRDLLLVRGVSVDVTLGSGQAPADAAELVRVESPTVRALVQQMLRESDNNTAEILLREVGLRAGGARAGTTAAGAAAVERTVAGLVDPRPPPAVVDGSGLDRGNSATCGQLVAVLESFGPDSAVGRALPVAARSGTLSHRFADHPAAGRLSAKTGLLTGVNSLAGFLKTPTGMLTFAQIVNGVPPDSRVGLESQETLVEALLGHPADCSTAVALLDAPWSSAAAASAAALSPAPATGITPQPCIVVPAPPEPPASEEPDPADTSTTDPSAQE